MNDEQQNHDANLSSESVVPGLKTVSPFKYLPLMIFLSFVVVFTSALVIMLLSNSGKTRFKKQEVANLADQRPTATIYLLPTVNELMPSREAESPATVSAQLNITISPSIAQDPDVVSTASDTGRLAFIKDGDIYNSDFTTYKLMIKNATPASNLLSWSPRGNLLAWRSAFSESSSSAVTVYDRNTNTFQIIPPEIEAGSEILDFAFSIDEKRMVVLQHSDKFKLNLFNLQNSIQPAQEIVSTEKMTVKIFWTGTDTIYSAGDDGIMVYNLSDNSSRSVTSHKRIISAGISPNQDKILYFTEDGGRYFPSVLDIASEKIIEIPEKPQNTDMADAGVTFDSLSKGFYPRAIFFPGGNKILAAYNYLPGVPFTGIFDLENMSFSGIAPMVLYPDDVMIDDLRLIGGRVNTTTRTPSWQLGVYTMEDNAKLSAIRIIPGGYSPAFYFGN